MNYLIQFDPACLKWVTGLTEEQKIRLGADIPQLGIDASTKDGWCVYDKVVLVTEEQKIQLEELAAPFVVKDFKKLKLKEVVSNSTSFHVHVPSFGMMNIKKLHYLTDACTNVVQEHLNEGWRILCICPPLDARRPDYILGRGDDVTDM
jgi:hypothetical protein